MSNAQITPGKNGEFLVSGIMDFETIPDLWKQSQSMFLTDGAITVDFRQVEHSNSAGLALIIEWIRFAQFKKRRFNLVNLPSQLQEIAKISGIEDILAHCKG